MTERRSNKLVKSNNGLVKSFCLCGLIFANTLLAQQSNSLLTDSPHILDQQSFQQELDRWMLSAYEGDRNSQFQVAMAFISDQMIEPDYEQAVYWYKQAARQGHIIAQYNLGHQYMVGQGVQKSERLATDWWNKAARQGHSLAQFNLGRAYYLGIGVDKNEQQSRFWFEQAALNQEPKSLEILQQLGWEKDLSSVEPIETIANNADDSLDNNLAINTLSDNSDASIDASSSIVIAPSSANAQQNQSQFTSRIIPVPTTLTQSATEQASLEAATNLEAAIKTSDQSPLILETQTTAIDAAKPGIAHSPATSTSNNEQGSLANQAASESKQATTAALAKPVKRNIPLAVYTNPSIRSILIGLVDDVDNITVINNGSKWLHVQSNTGLPVWVHSDFLEALNDTGTINAVNVNTRAVPLVVDGSKVGKLNKGDIVKVLESRNGWHRVISPPFFKAWAQVAEYDKALTSKMSIKESANNSINENLKEGIEESVNTGGKKNINKSLIDNVQKTTIPNTNAELLASDSLNEANNKPLPGSSPTNWQTRSSNKSNEKTSSASINDERLTNTNKPSVLRENDNDWLFAQTPESYTLQLASFDDEKKVNAFLTKQKQIDNSQLHRFTATSNGIDWTYFLYGSYQTAELAKKARKEINLPKAWIRNFQHLTQNRCISWKKQLPPPRELKRYCLK